MAETKTKKQASTQTTKTPMAQRILFGRPPEELRHRLPRRDLKAEKAQRQAWPVLPQVAGYAAALLLLVAAGTAVAQLKVNEGNIPLVATVWITAGIAIMLLGTMTGFLPRSQSALTWTILSWLTGLLALPFVGTALQSPQFVIVVPAILFGAIFVWFAARFTTAVRLHREGYKV